MKLALKLFPVLACAVMVTGCSSSDDASKSAHKGLTAPVAAVLAENKKNPLAKYLEVAGFRLSESKQGKLTVKFDVINHSDADIANLVLNVGLKPTTAKAEEPPFCSFPVKVPSLGPQEVANTTGECVTSLRVYELPDWQFIRPSFTITSPSE